MVRDRERVGEGRVGEREGRGVGHHSRHVGDGVVHHALDPVGRIGVRGGARGLGAPALVDREVDEGGAGTHGRHQGAGDEPRRARARDEHGAHGQVGGGHLLLDVGPVRHDGGHVAAEDVVHIAELAGVDVED